MRNIMLAIVLASSALAAGCSSPIEAACNKGGECGELGNKTVEQCIADTNKTLDRYRTAKKEACDKIADAYEAMYDCVAGLSCADMKKEDVSDTDCKQAVADLQAAAIANAKDCGVEE